MKSELLVILLALLLPSVSHNSEPVYSTVTPIQHVVIIMQENHSFDNYFGTYPTANGTLLNPITSQLQHVNGIPNHVCLPYMASCISPQLSTSQYPSNPFEGQLTYQMDYSNNATGFPTSSGPQSMVYFDYHSIAGYWDYAEDYGIADNYFSSVLGMTAPNRLMILSGNTTVSADYGPPPYIHYNDTVFHQLDEKGVSWGYYDYTSSYGGPSGTYPLSYFSDRTHQALLNTQNISVLFRQLAEGNGLPSINFVSSLGYSQLDEHPDSSPTAGELWTISVINQLMDSIYWPSTAIFVTWDEGGGFYDHVIPPNEFSLNNAFSSPLLGFGQRVPLLVISPFAKENFVSHDLMNHLSLLHLIEYNWNLTPLNKLVAKANLPLSFFNFSQPPRSPLLLSSSPTYPIPPRDNLIELPLSLPILLTLIIGSQIAICIVFLRGKIHSSRFQKRKKSS